MEKRITINDDQVTLFVLQVFDEKLGHINEHILAVDITNIYYKNDSILETVKIVKTDFSSLKTIYYRMSADNYNHVYISPVGVKTEAHAVKEINTSIQDHEKYGATVATLHSKY